MVQIGNGAEYKTIATPQKILRMVSNERTAGSIPSWETPRTPKDNILSGLEQAIEKPSAVGASQLSYRAPETAAPATKEEFRFVDLLDMINPLQHIPLVNIAYREITGDQIKPIGQIIGGAVYGGPAGAAGGLINAVIQEETGKDLAGNIFSALKDEKHTSPSPEDLKIAHEQNIAAYEDLPIALLAFAQTPLPAPYTDKQLESDTHTGKHGEKYVLFADERTAGRIAQYG